MANMIPISTVTVGSGGTSSVSFVGIPQTYTDLVIKMSARTSRSAVYGEMYMRFNESTTNYASRALESSGSSVGSYSESTIRVEFNGDTSTANIFGNAEWYIPNYTSSNFKSVNLESVTENTSASVDSFLKSHLWSNTSPINSISIGFGTGTISQYSTFTLYGIRKY